jgi:hypothetical protein
MASRGWAVVRAAVAVVLVAPTAFVVFGILGVAGAQWGWLLFAVALGLPSVLACRLAWGRRAPGREMATIVVVALATVTGVAFARTAPYTHGRLTADLGDIALRLPETWRVVRVERNGNTLCFDVCPSVAFEWSTPSPASANGRTVDRALDGAGFRRHAGAYLTTYERGRLLLQVTVRDRSIVISAESR